MRRLSKVVGATIVVWAIMAPNATAQSARITGVVRDETGGALPGVSVELRNERELVSQAVTDTQGAYRLEHLAPGRVHLSFALINFAVVRRDVDVAAFDDVQLNPVLHLALSADITVTGKGTFTNLADAENPTQNLVGIAQSASQGAIT